MQINRRVSAATRRSGTFARQVTDVGHYELSRLRQRLPSRLQGGSDAQVTRLEPRRGGNGSRALLSYLAAPLDWSAHKKRLRQHSNAWECREMAIALTELGYSVDAIDWNASHFRHTGDYDLILALDQEAVRLHESQDSFGTLVMHLTGADPFFQRSAELERIAMASARRNTEFVPKRVNSNPGGARAGHLAAASCSLIGNSWTLSTYPEEVQRKTSLINVTASPVQPLTDSEIKRSASSREYLWFFGGGAIHKGLDVALEVFSQRQDLALHVVGSLADEDDFTRAYRRELRQCPNIYWYGPLTPSSRIFRRIISRTSTFLGPSCSEGMSPACATLLTAGLLPIITEQTGITLPQATTSYLPTIDAEALETAIEETTALKTDERVELRTSLRDDAMSRYSRQRFRASIRRYLRSVT